MTAIHVWIVIAAFLWMGFSGPGSVGAAEIYFWTDENGVPHFSNVRPDGQGEVAQKLRELPHDPAAAARRERAMEEAAARRAEERREREVRELREAVERAEAAARAAERHAEEARRLEASRETAPEDDEPDRIRYRVPIGLYRHPPMVGRSHGHPVLGINPPPPPENPETSDGQFRGSRHPRRPRPNDPPRRPRRDRRRPRRSHPFCPLCPVPGGP
ncbi:MAG: DUF4124 domain-containing protein [Desulfococcaceae bacterium]